MEETGCIRVWTKHQRTGNSARDLHIIKNAAGMTGCVFSHLSNISSYLPELKHFPIYTIIAREFFLFYSYLKLFELLAEPVVFRIQKNRQPSGCL